jgi:uncharacterized protein YjbI with pentapeptide repeats
MSAPSAAPYWTHCAHAAGDPVGCRDVHVAGHTACLAHLADADRDDYLAGLTPGASIDHRGTTFTDSLLTALLNALRDPATANVRLGTGLFVEATFEGTAVFESATFVEAGSFGPLMCAGRVVLSGAVFGGPATLSFAARRLECRRTCWSRTAEIRLRYATVDFAHAVCEYPLTIAAEPDAFVFPNGRQLAEDLFPNAPDSVVRVASLRGVDAAHLVLADLDLSGCLFAGTVYLDQLRLEGACTFDTAPHAVRWRRWLPVW